MKRHVLDQLVARAISRKFLAWIVACVFLGLGYVEAGDWIALTGVYLGVQGASDLLAVRAGAQSIVEAIEPPCEDE